MSDDFEVDSFLKRSGSIGRLVRHVISVAILLATSVKSSAQESYPEVPGPRTLPPTVVEGTVEPAKPQVLPSEAEPSPLSIPNVDGNSDASSQAVPSGQDYGSPSSQLMPRTSARSASNRNSQSRWQSSGSTTSLGRAGNLVGETSSASQGRFSQSDISKRPLSRSGELLELAPGLIATQHSGSGKANQFFVRGLNLDHGTDLAFRVDGVPINLPSHGHGQGYLDINWLIPELVDYVDYRLGPYYADVGDFSSAGALDLHYLRSMPNGVASITAGSFDYYRTLIADSKEFGGGELLYAFETTFYDGVWDVPEDLEKLNGVLRWSTGDASQGMTLSAMAYKANWTATNQIARRAVDAGIVGRFGSLDPSDGGRTLRTSLNLESWSRDADSETLANIYVTGYDLDLFSNFTYFLEDPVNGDQIRQTDNRVYAGFNVSRTLHRTDMDHTFGTQFRNDTIYNLALGRSRQRETISPTRVDNVDQQDYALYYNNRTQWTEKVRSSAGLRGDLFRFHNRAEIIPADSGSVVDTILSPKAGLVFGPWSDTEVFLNWGQAFHSNDARGVNASVDPSNPLVKSEGEEVGARSLLTPDWNSTLTAWHLTLDSELVFVGDAGTTEAGPASERFGVTWSNHYQVFRNLLLDADYSFVRPRFTTGERIPNALSNVLGTGAFFRNPGSPWYSSVRLRHYGPAALIEDNSARSSTTTLVNMQVGYEKPRWLAAVDFFNIFNRKDNDIIYFYESQPLGLSAADDFQFHPVEPYMARATWIAKF